MNGRRLQAVCVFAIGLGACSGPAASGVLTGPPPSATATAPALRTTATPSPLPSSPLPSRPITLATGIEVFAAPVSVRGADSGEAFLVARIDPVTADIRVKYSPSKPRAVREWQVALDADVVINAGYFTEDNAATALLIADGVVHGQSYRGFGGLFAVRPGPPPSLSLQWLKEQPYAADRRIVQAIESFPMLVRKGKVVDGIVDDGRRNRRSFIALDRSGRLLIGVTRYASLTLTDLAAALAGEPGLAVDAAMNLDGGASSGLWLRAPGDALSIDSLDVVPAVVVVTARRR